MSSVNVHTSSRKVPVIFVRFQ